MEDRRAEAAGGGAHHPFASIFLVLFLLDGLVTVTVGAADLRPGLLFDPAAAEFLLMPFGIALFLGSMVQVTLAFTRRMRWSARIIGLYVIVAYWVLPSVIAVVLLSAADSVPAEGTSLISRTALGWLNLTLGALQVGLGAWAGRDLSAGQYLPPDRNERRI